MQQHACRFRNWNLGPGPPQNKRRAPTCPVPTVALSNEKRSVQNEIPKVGNGRVFYFRNLTLTLSHGLFQMTPTRFMTLFLREYQYHKIELVSLLFSMIFYFFLIILIFLRVSHQIASQFLTFLGSFSLNKPGKNLTIYPEFLKDSSNDS